MLVIIGTNLRITQTIPEQQNGKERLQGAKDSNNIRHCTHTHCGKSTKRLLLEIQLHLP
jgi:hypothetical protein